MRKTTNFLFMLVSSIILFGCSYDDSEIWSEIDKIKTDLASLKTQVTSVETIVDALKAHKVITKVDKLNDGKGHKITFNDGTEIDVLNGTDAPVIGIREEDGSYYWTITTGGQTEFLLDKDNNKLAVSGKDGQTPVLGIDDGGYWTLNGARIKDAGGKEVKAQGDSFFKEIKDGETTVTFILAGGGELVLPKSGGTFLVFDNPDNEPFFLFKVGVRKALAINFANVNEIEIVSKPEGWSANIHLPKKEVSVMVAQGAAFGIGEIRIQGIDKNGLVFQAIAKVGIEGNLFSDPKGVFILNEGNMTTENGSLVYIPALGNVIDRAYYNANGTELGNVSQDLFIKDGRIYIIAQNGKKNAMGTGFENDGMLVVANAATLKKEATFNDELSTLSWPTHIAVLNENNIFIRDNKGIYRFDSATRNLVFVTGTDGALKNRMAVAGGKVFVPGGGRIFVLEANKDEVAGTIEAGAGISGLLRSKDGNIWVSTTGSPNKIAKINSADYTIIKTNEITEGRVGAGWGATPGISAKGDTLYYSNASTTIYRHIFSTGESTLMVDAKTMVENANIVYNNLAVHPLTGEVYLNTIKGYGWDFLINNISVFDFDNGAPAVAANYRDYTHFPAGIFFAADFQ